MPTKAELVTFAQEKGIEADESMLKADIEARIQEAGYDPVSLTPLPPEEEPAVSEEQQQQSQVPEPEPPSEEYDPEKAAERGWWGTRPGDIDDSEYSLESGGDSPNANMLSDGVRLLDPDKDIDEETGQVKPASER